MQAIYFADALKIKWLENLTYLFPASTVLVITKEGGCLLSLNSSSKCKELVYVWIVVASYLHKVM